MTEVKAIRVRKLSESSFTFQAGQFSQLNLKKVEPASLMTDVLHQSIPAVPSPCTRGYCGAFAYLVSPRGGALVNFALPGGWAFANPLRPPQAFDMYVVSYPNITTQRILLEKQADWLICQGREKL